MHRDNLVLWMPVVARQRRRARGAQARRIVSDPEPGGADVWVCQSKLALLLRRLVESTRLAQLQAGCGAAEGRIDAGMLVDGIDPLIGACSAPRSGLHAPEM